MEAEHRVLIVDDEEEFVSALAERLNLRGFQARGVTSGREALESIESGWCDVVLLDVKMPGLGGLELTRLIKERRPDLQVVLLTGHTSAGNAEEGRRVGAYEYLMKPVKIGDLVRVLRSAAAGDATEEEDES